MSYRTSYCLVLSGFDVWGANYNFSHKCGRFPGPLNSVWLPQFCHSRFGRKDKTMADTNSHVCSLPHSPSQGLATTCSPPCARVTQAIDSTDTKICCPYTQIRYLFYLLFPSLISLFSCLLFVGPGPPRPHQSHRCPAIVSRQLG